METASCRVTPPLSFSSIKNVRKSFKPSTLRRHLGGTGHCQPRLFGYLRKQKKEKENLFHQKSY